MSDPTIDPGDGDDSREDQVELRAEKAYLLQNKLNPLPVPGDLELTRAKLRFMLRPSAVDAVVGWLEKELEVSDLHGRLEAGEAISAFELDRAALEVKWPLQFAGVGMQVSNPGTRKWLVSLVYPSGGGYTLLRTFSGAGRGKSKEWKTALGGR
jgi:hypothetical protein